jgi:ElaA protein
VTVELFRSWAKDLDASTLYGLLKLRAEVFVVEQTCPYLDPDGADMLPGTRHFWLAGRDGSVCATLRLLEDEPMPDGGDERAFWIGRVCTGASVRGRGYATLLMEAALAEIGPNPCRIHAQTYLADMYGSLGFVQDGEEFVEDGIPHVPMLRPAASSGSFVVAETS